MQRDTWNSKLGFILATAGSAIGLGNIWRFPYLAGENGGGSFLLLYLLSVFGLGYFLLLSKLAFGRLASSNIIDGFKTASQNVGKNFSKNYGRFAGFLTLFNTMLVASIYLVVIGWTLFYAVHTFGYLFNLTTALPNKHVFEQLTTSFYDQFLFGTLCALITAGILIQGVKKGIEKISLILMPLLFLILIFMVVRIFFIPNAIEGIKFFLIPDWSSMGFKETGFDFKAFADLFLKALGQAVYSLSMGLGVIFVYGSYLSKKENILKSTKHIVLLDTLVAFLAGLIVLPAVFAFHLEPNAGPTLTFITLPFVFEKIAGGIFFMFLFFLLLFIAALTSLISIYEPPVNLLIEKTKMTRKKAVFLVTGLNIFGTFIVLLSFTKIWDIQLLNMDLFNFFDTLTGTFTMTFAVLFISLFMGWGISSGLIRSLKQGAEKAPSKFFRRYLRFTLRFTAPIVLILLLIKGVISLL